jgi:PII-like signaling protein
MHRLVVEALAGAGMAGATTFLGIGGFGQRRYISRADVVDAFVDLPVLIEVVDDDAKIRGFIPTLETLLDDGLVTLERVQTIAYRAG